MGIVYDNLIEVKKNTKPSDKVFGIFDLELEIYLEIGALDLEFSLFYLIRDRHIARHLLFPCRDLRR